MSDTGCESLFSARDPDRDPVAAAESRHSDEAGGIDTSLLTAAPVRDDEVELVLDIFRAYGRPLGASGVLLGLAVVTRENDRRVRVVLDAMERRGLIRVKHPARAADHDDLFVLTEDE